MRYAVNGIELDVTEAGDPRHPAVLLLHGFPECAYSWRHQLAPLAAAGYHVLAPDQRGYAGSGAPRDVAAYGVEQLAGDAVGVIEASGHEDAVVVGHDWGALLMWDLARLHPDRVRAAIGVSVPYTPWPAPPTELFRAAAGDSFFYILYFQPVGPAEAELEADVETTLRSVLWAASGDGAPAERPPAIPAAGNGFLDWLHSIGEPPDELPAWLTEDDLAVFVAAFERSGFFGPLSWYRNMDANYRALAGRPFPPIPTGFIGGDRDGVTADRPGYVDSMTARLPDHRRTTMLQGVGHWTQQEDPAAFTAALLETLADVAI